MKTQKIETLTPEQIAKFPAYVERWTRIGLSTEPADRPGAERAIVAMYAAAKLPAPRVVWCGSPLSNALTRAIVLKIANEETGDSVGASVRDSVWASVRASVEASVGASVWASVGDSVWASVWASVEASVRDSVRASVGDSVGDSVRASVRDSVGDSVRASVRDSVRASVRDSVGASVRDSVWASVRASVRDSVWASVRASVRDSVWASVRASVYGQHDANWIAFYAFFREQCGLSEQTNLLKGLTELTQCAGWAVPHEKICWVSERHSVLNRDIDGRLHCETGPSLAYPDGWRLWHIHGVSVDQQIVLAPETQTVEQIASEPNEEIKRVRIDRFGWERWLRETNARQIDRRRNEIDAQDEELYEDGDGRRRIIVSDPSTGRRYPLGVPRDVTTCEQAQRYLSHGLSKLCSHRS